MAETNSCQLKQKGRFGEGHGTVIRIDSATAPNKDPLGTFLSWELLRDKMGLLIFELSVILAKIKSIGKEPMNGLGHGSVIWLRQSKATRL